jgi:hypothetical protein
MYHLSCTCYGPEGRPGTLPSQEEGTLGLGEKITKLTLQKGSAPEKLS